MVLIDKLKGNKDIRFREDMKCENAHFNQEIVCVVPELNHLIERGAVPYCKLTEKLCVAYDPNLDLVLYDCQRAKLCPKYEKK